MRLREPEMRRLAAAVVDHLERAELLRISGRRDTVEKRIVDAFRTNVRAEEELDLEAKKFAAAHSRELVGMDRYKILQMVKERLAKEKGFTL